MEASKLTVSPETLRFKKMTPGQRTKLRRKLIIEFIQSKPYGTKITGKDFAVITQTTQTAAAALVRTMVKGGKLNRDEVGKKAYAYRVNGEEHVVTPPRPSKPDNSDNVIPPPSNDKDRHPGGVRQRVRLGLWQRQPTRVRHLDGWQGIGAQAPS